MKKLFTTLVTICLTAVASACGSDPEVDAVTGATEQPGKDDNSGEGGKGKSLVVYFSRADENYQVGYVERGNTAIMVDYIKENADVDVFEIVPEVAYPSDYNECINYVTEEINENRRPAYKNDTISLADYDNIFVGGPVWWGRPPMIIRTFIEAHQEEFSNKTVIPFGTHAGSGISSYNSLFREYFPNITLLESLGISGASIRNSSSEATAVNWLKRIGLDRETTSISTTRAQQKEDYIEFSLNGNRVNGSKGIYIKNNKKYIRR